jgi:hypothetical protein
MEKTLWTPQMRNDFVKKALSSEEERGHNGPYWFNVLPKNTKPDEENPKKSAVTKVLMNTIFENPQYRIFALKMYDILINKIMGNPFTRPHFMKNIVVQLKGGVSYTYLIGESNDDFPYSDLDIVIYINPYLPTDFFKQIKDTLSTIVLQTISQYKRSIDFMFFSNKERFTPEQIERQNAEQFLSDDLIDSFKADYNEALASLSDDKGTYLSPFENNEFRNAASKQSYMICNSNVKENSVVRVELPHFEMCERIPLRKTPMLCSYNKTIDFNRLGNDNDSSMKGAFDLYRIRFNNQYVSSETNTDDRIIRENITADFIDISIAGQEDVELISFWNYGRYLTINDTASNVWITIPDAATMLDDLWKMLNLYECPEAKKEKRQKRFEILEKLVCKTQ